MERINLKKYLSVFLINCFLFSFVYGQVLAEISESAAAARHYEQMLNKFVVSGSYGKITDSNFAASDTVIVQIQDLHCQPQVQKNISKIIETLDAKFAAAGGISNIWLEGAYGQINTQWLNSTDIERLADSGRLTGAEYYSVAKGKYEIIKGLENKEEYLDNLKRFGEILTDKEKISALVSGIKESTKQLEEKYYNKMQLKLAKLRQNHSEGKISDKKYYTLLLKHADKLSIDFHKYKNLTLYVSSLETENKLNYKKIAKQLNWLVSAMKEKLSYNAYRAISDATDNFSETDKLAVYLKDFVERSNIDLNANFSELGEFFKYAEITGDMNPVELVNEENALRNEINARFADTKVQSEACFLVGFGEYMENYLTAKITPKDYEYYKANEQKYRKLWVKYIDNKVLDLTRYYADKVDRFYKINLDRNGYFAANIFAGDVCVNKMDSYLEKETACESIFENISGVKKIDVVITGGFHSRGVSKILKEKGISYILITPNAQGDSKAANETYYKIAKEQARQIRESEIQLSGVSLPDSSLKSTIGNPDSYALANLILTLDVPSRNAFIEALQSGKTISEQDLSAAAKELADMALLVKEAMIVESDEDREIEEAAIETIRRNLPQDSRHAGMITPSLLEKINMNEVRRALDEDVTKLDDILETAQIRGNSSGRIYAELKIIINRIKKYKDRLFYSPLSIKQPINSYEEALGRFAGRNGHQSYYKRNEDGALELYNARSIDEVLETIDFLAERNIDNYEIILQGLHPDYDDISTFPPNSDFWLKDKTTGEIRKVLADLSSELEKKAQEITARAQKKGIRLCAHLQGFSPVNESQWPKYDALGKPRDIMTEILDAQLDMCKKLGITSAVLHLTGNNMEAIKGYAEFVGKAARNGITIKFENDIIYDDESGYVYEQPLADRGFAGHETFIESLKNIRQQLRKETKKYMGVTLDTAKALQSFTESPKVDSDGNISKEEYEKQAKKINTGNLKIYCEAIISAGFVINEIHLAQSRVDTDDVMTEKSKENSEKKVFYKKAKIDDDVNPNLNILEFLQYLTDTGFEGLLLQETPGLTAPYRPGNRAVLELPTVAVQSDAKGLTGVKRAFYIARKEFIASLRRDFVARHYGRDGPAAEDKSVSGYKSRRIGNILIKVMSASGAAAGAIIPAILLSASPLIIIIPSVIVSSSALLSAFNILTHAAYNIFVERKYGFPVISEKVKLSLEEEEQNILSGSLAAAPASGGNNNNSSIEHPASMSGADIENWIKSLELRLIEIGIENIPAFGLRNVSRKYYGNNREREYMVTIDPGLFFTEMSASPDEEITKYYQDAAIPPIPEIFISLLRNTFLSLHFGIEIQDLNNPDLEDTPVFIAFNMPLLSLFKKNKNAIHNRGSFSDFGAYSLTEAESVAAPIQGRGARWYDADGANIPSTSYGEMFAVMLAQKELDDIRKSVVDYIATVLKSYLDEKGLPLTQEHYDYYLRLILSRYIEKYLYGKYLEQLIRVTEDRAGYSKENPAQNPQLTMKWLQWIFKTFNFSKTRAEKWVNVIETPIMVLGAWVPLVQKMFLFLHSKEDRERLKETLSLQDGINSHTRQAFKAATTQINFPVIKQIARFSLGILSAFEINAKLHAEFNNPVLRFKNILYEKLKDGYVDYRDIELEARAIDGYSEEQLREILTEEEINVLRVFRSVELHDLPDNTQIRLLRFLKRPIFEPSLKIYMSFQTPQAEPEINKSSRFKTVIEAADRAIDYFYAAGNYVSDKYGAKYKPFFSKYAPKGALIIIGLLLIVNLCACGIVKTSISNNEQTQSGSQIEGSIDDPATQSLKTYFSKSVLYGLIDVMGVGNNSETIDAAINASVEMTLKKENQDLIKSAYEKLKKAGIIFNNECTVLLISGAEYESSFAIGVERVIAISALNIDGKSDEEKIDVLALKIAHEHMHVDNALDKPQISSFEDEQLAYFNEYKATKALGSGVLPDNIKNPEEYLHISQAMGILDKEAEFLNEQLGKYFSADPKLKYYMLMTASIDPALEKGQVGIIIYDAKQPEKERKFSLVRVDAVKEKIYEIYMVDAKDMPPLLEIPKNAAQADKKGLYGIKRALYIAYKEAAHAMLPGFVAKHYGSDARRYNEDEKLTREYKIRVIGDILIKTMSLAGAVLGMAIPIWVFAAPFFAAFFAAPAAAFFMNILTHAVFNYAIGKMNNRRASPKADANAATTKTVGETKAGYPVKVYSSDKESGESEAISPKNAGEPAESSADVRFSAPYPVNKFIAEKLSLYFLGADAAVYPGEIAIEEEILIDGLDYAKLQKLFEIAQRHHAGQNRKNGQPYIAHLLYVALLLIDFGIRELELIAASVLHDSLEDSIFYYESYDPNFAGLDARETREKSKRDFTEEKILLVKEDIANSLRESGFSEESVLKIMKYVEAMTKRAKENITTSYFPRLIEAGENAVILKLADRIANTAEINEKALRYMFGRGNEKKGTIELFIETHLETGSTFLESSSNEYVKISFKIALLKSILNNYENMKESGFIHNIRQTVLRIDPSLEIGNEFKEAQDILRKAISIEEERLASLETPDTSKIFKNKILTAAGKSSLDAVRPDTAAGQSQKIAVKALPSKMRLESLGSEKIEESLVITQDEAQAKLLATHGFKTALAAVSGEKPEFSQGWRKVKIIFNTLDGKNIRTYWKTENGILKIAFYSKRGAVNAEYALENLQDIVFEGIKDDAFKNIRQIIVVESAGISPESVVNIMKNQFTDLSGMKIKEAVLDISQRDAIRNFKNMCVTEFKINDIGIFLINEYQAKRYFAEIAAMRKNGIKFIIKREVSQADIFELDGAMIDAVSITEYDKALKLLEELVKLKANISDGYNLRITVAFNSDILGKFNFDIWKRYGIIPSAQYARSLNYTMRREVIFDNNAQAADIANILADDNITAFAVTDTIALSDIKEQRRNMSSEKQRYNKGYRASLNGRFDYTMADVSQVYGLISSDLTQFGNIRETIIDFLNRADSFSPDSKSYIDYLLNKGRYAEIAGFVRGAAMNSVKNEIAGILKTDGINIDIDELQKDDMFMKSFLDLALKLKMQGADLKQLYFGGKSFESISVNAGDYIRDISLQLNVYIEKDIRDDEFSVAPLEAGKLGEAEEIFGKFIVVLGEKFRKYDIPEEIIISLNAARAILSAA
ncbi:MAG: hypothetical protein LBO62_01565 [Endomicrobium sp.]|jgi:hypothetical protein|nr:hypothetical protein [Endomicrobium sp.]